MKTLKSLLGYIGCICITVAVAYYIDGTAGIILTTALILALVISLALTLAVKPFLRADISADRDLLVKGDALVLSVKLSKRIILPAPVIEIEADCSAHLKLTESRVYKGSVAGKETTEIKIPFSAVHSGAAEVRITRLALTDFLGVFSFKLPLPHESAAVKISIYPNIPDTGVQTDFLKTASMFSSSDDDEEESGETAIGSTGTPGYDHRRYYPGDPIKKINWKLSSKRDIYMVRLDEKIYAAGQMFFLDCPVYEENEYILSVRDNVIEGALAMFAMLVRDGKEASFFRRQDGLWLRTDIRTMPDVYRLQEQLAGFSPCAADRLIPPEITDAGKTPICFTAAVASDPSTAAAIVSQSSDSLIISAEIAGLQNISPNLWTVSAEFEFKKRSET